MHIRFTKRGVTTLLLLALLIVTVAIVLPIVASAAGASANSGVHKIPFPQCFDAD